MGGCISYLTYLINQTFEIINKVLGNLQNYQVWEGKAVKLPSGLSRCSFLGVIESQNLDLGKLLVPRYFTILAYANYFAIRHDIQIHPPVGCQELLDKHHKGELRAVTQAAESGFTNDSRFLTHTCGNMWRYPDICGGL